MAARHPVRRQPAGAPGGTKKPTVDERLAAIEARLEDLGRLVCPVCAPAAVAAIHPDVVPTRVSGHAPPDELDLTNGAVAERLDRLTG